MAAVTSQMPASPVAPSESGAVDWVPPDLARLTLEQYEAMVASEVFTKRDRFQLINGYLVTKVSKNPSRVSATGRAFRSIGKIIPDGWCVRNGDPVRLPPRSEPEPDVAVARGNSEDYDLRYPGPGELALIVEVSRRTISEDRGIARIYGPAGIPIYWIVNLIARHIEVYNGPGPDGYATCVVYKPDDFVPVVIDGVEVGRIAVDDLMPPAQAAAD
jgi:Uma2 family endonuclease